MNKALILILSLLSFFMPLGAQELSFSQALNLQTELLSISEAKQAFALVESYERRLDAQALQREEGLAASNVIVIEKINLLNSMGAEEKKEAYVLLAGQIGRNELFMQGKNSASFTPSFLVMYANLKSYQLKFLAGNALLKESMKTRDLYLAALKKNKNSSHALAHYALWLYFAPAIAGGGYDAALKTINNAEKQAANDRERFFALLYRSQILVKMKRKKEAAADLARARAIFPTELFTQTLREKNEKGFTLFD